MEVQETASDSGTNCKDCERYKTLGEVCVIEHGKKFLWEFCKDFQPEVKLPDYNDLMRTVKREIAVEREKARQKKKRERALRSKEREEKRRFLIAKKRAASRAKKGEKKLEMSASFQDSNSYSKARPKVRPSARRASDEIAEATVSRGRKNSRGVKRSGPVIGKKTVLPDDEPVTKENHPTPPHTKASSSRGNATARRNR